MTTNYYQRKNPKRSTRKNLKNKKTKDKKRSKKDIKIFLKDKSRSYLSV